MTWFISLTVGEVRLYLNSHCFACVLSITDSGSDIAPELQARIFEEGIKGLDSTGLGMGLNIVKRLRERYAVKYAIKSVPQGTEFTLLFDQS